MASDETFEAWWERRPKALAALNPNNDSHDHAKEYARAAWQARGKVAAMEMVRSYNHLIAERDRARAEVERLTAYEHEVYDLTAERDELRAQLAGAEEQNRSLQELLDESNRKLEAVDAFDSIDSPSDRGDV